MKKTIDDIEVHGKRVLVRLDLNVPLDESGCITNDRRIRSALPTLEKLMTAGARLVLMSHLGRPQGDAGDRQRLSLAPVAKRLEELLNHAVLLASDCIGDEVQALVERMGDGDVCLLENLRIHRAETIKDKNAESDTSARENKDAFARRLATLGDVYVNDAFGTCHRDNASMLTVPRMMAGKPRVVGYLVERELRFLGQTLEQPPRPFVCVLGGAKVSDKLGAIRTLLGKCDTVLVGGAMAYTFLAAGGMDVGKSLTEPELFDTARALMSEAGDRLHLPMDSIAAIEIDTDVETHICHGDIPDNLMGLDIGPKTIDAYRTALLSARTIVWNGPMGVFEVPPFDRGTIALANAVAEATDQGAVSIVGGGDSAAAVEQSGLGDRMSYISTGGGASLEFLEGKPFAAIDVLDDVKCPNA